MSSLNSDFSEDNSVEQNMVSHIVSEIHNRIEKETLARLRSNLKSILGLEFESEEDFLKYSKSNVFRITSSMNPLNHELYVEVGEKQVKVFEYSEKIDVDYTEIENLKIQATYSRYYK